MKIKKSDGRFAGIVGQEYDRLLKALPHIPALEEGVASAVRKGLQKNMIRSATILDLGCGNGITTLALCAQINNAHIIGVDIEPTMLKQYESRVADVQNTVTMHQCDALEFLKGSAAHSFDVVVSGLVLHNLPKTMRAEIIKEIARVLRPNAWFVNGDKIAHDDDKAHQQDLMRQFAKFTEVYSAPSDIAYGLEWIEHYVRDNQPDLKYTESEIVHSLEVAGFKKIKIVKRYGMEALVVADI